MYQQSFLRSFIPPTHHHLIFTVRPDAREPKEAAPEVAAFPVAAAASATASKSGGAAVHRTVPLATPPKQSSKNSTTNGIDRGDAGSQGSSSASGGGPVPAATPVPPTAAPADPAEPGPQVAPTITSVSASASEGASGGTMFTEFTCISNRFIPPTHHHLIFTVRPDAREPKEAAAAKKNLMLPKPAAPKAALADFFRHHHLIFTVRPDAASATASKRFVAAGDATKAKQQNTTTNGIDGGDAGSRGSSSASASGRGPVPPTSAEQGQLQPRSRGSSSESGGGGTGGAHATPIRTKSASPANLKRKLEDAPEAAPVDFRRLLRGSGGDARSRRSSGSSASGEVPVPAAIPVPPTAADRAEPGPETARGNRGEGTKDIMIERKQKSTTNGIRGGDTGSRGSSSASGGGGAGGKRKAATQGDAGSQGSSSASGRGGAEGRTAAANNKPGEQPTHGRSNASASASRGMKMLSLLMVAFDTGVGGVRFSTPTPTGTRSAGVQAKHMTASGAGSGCGGSAGGSSGAAPCTGLVAGSLGGFYLGHLRSQQATLPAR